MSITPGTSGERSAASARPTPTPPGVPGATGDDALRGFLGGNLIGSAGSGLDEAQGVQPGDGSLLERDMPIGSALAGLHGRHPDVQDDDVPHAADTTLDAGPATLATSGGERATAGRAPGTRSSRTDADTLQSDGEGLE